MKLKKNLDVMIQEKLEDEIICGNWTPGQALNLDELAEHYGVSRTPIQQALKNMDIQGMVRFSSKGHFYVLSFCEKEVKDIIEVRLLLEQKAISDIEKSQAEIDFKSLSQVCAQCVDYNETGDIVQLRRTDLLFHRMLVEQAGNYCLSEMYNRVQRQFMVANYLLASHTKDQQKTASTDHELVLKALKSGNFKKAHEILELHIQGACEKMLKRMR